MKKILLITAALFSISTAAAQLTPDTVIEAITKDTDLYAEDSPACSNAEDFHRLITMPEDSTASSYFVNTYNFTYDSTSDEVPKEQIRESVKDFDEIMWLGSSWNPWRLFIVNNPSMRKYYFYVQIITPDDDDFNSIGSDMDYTAVCITVNKLN